MTVTQPLLGKRILVTRPRAQAGALAEKLAGQGAQPIVYPMIEIAPVDDSGPLDTALRQLDQYQWLVFTSANGVAAVWARLASHLPVTIQLAAVGPATARALEQRGARAAFIPDEYVAEALAAGLGDVAGQRVLLPHAELAREVLADELRRRGAVVDEVAVYRTLPAAPDPAGLADLRRGVDAITFTSASAATNFAQLHGARLAENPRPMVVCIGPVTAAAARAAGLPVDAVAAEYSLDGLVAALAGCLTRLQPQVKEDPWTPLPPH